MSNACAAESCKLDEVKEELNPEEAAAFPERLTVIQEKTVPTNCDIITQEDDKIILGHIPKNCVPTHEVSRRYIDHDAYYKKEEELKKQCLSEKDEGADCNKKSESLLKCNDCGRFYSNNQSLTQHLRTHSVEKPFKCDVCTKCFFYVKTLKIHMRNHSGERPFTCDVCKKDFAVKSILKRHLKLHTAEKPFKCNLCDKCFTDTQSLKNHERCHNGQKPYKCDLCDKRFSRFTHLKRHEQQHTHSKPFKCDVCGKCFTEAGCLKRHARKHTGERPYNCDVCGMSFSESGSLRRHARVHTGERPYSCDFCQKFFSHSGTLKRHIRVHTGEKPYKCHVCGKAFAASGHLRRHARVHTDVLEYVKDLKKEVIELKNENAALKSLIAEILLRDRLHTKSVVTEPNVGQQAAVRQVGKSESGVAVKVASQKRAEKWLRLVAEYSAACKKLAQQVSGEPIATPNMHL
ncbi:hypothetical protein ANN_27920 [Periplaneta americana]|uniref:C2H2-type domain-containing protein n=1 Tax=Periplaneta americana TaxID=6978 RepID=A0ABQ8RVH5_PERAM|nr:hypothetical protein ANN_27920 [Periplaneta americana]